MKTTNAFMLIMALIVSMIAVPYAAKHFRSQLSHDTKAETLKEVARDAESITLKGGGGQVEPGHFFVLEGGTRNVLIRCEQYDLSQQTYSGCVLNKEDPAALDKAVTIIIQQMQRLRIEAASPRPTLSQRPRQLRSQQSAQTKDQ